MFLLYLGSFDESTVHQVPEEDYEEIICDDRLEICFLVELYEKTVSTVVCVH